MKVIGINGSARKDGNTAIIIQTVFGELRKAGIETELIQLAGETIEPCKGCFACAGKGDCIFGKDAFARVFRKMKEADGIILGSPVYSADVSATMKALLERGGVVVATNPGLLRHKVGAAVAAVRRGGGMTAVDTMNHFFLNKEVVVVGSTYWNMVYGKAPGEVFQDEEGMNNMRNLGKNMAWLLQRREAASPATPLAAPVSFPLFLGITLREVRMEDAAAIFRAIDTHRASLRTWLPFVDDMHTVADEEAFLRSVLDVPADKYDPIFGVVNEREEICGLIGFHFSDRANHRTEIGYWLLPEYRHRGIVTAGVRSLCRWAVTERGIRRIQIRCAVENEASNRVPQRLGFKHEGTERAGELLASGEYADINVYSILKEEVEAWE